jgi:2-polyprenyl-6-methoxyphenol hydroxylase-like FAD-dependent oxidoreductase
MSRNEQQPILIVGGGPTGVVMAIELSRRGVPYRIIDRKNEPTPTSRAFTIHAKTLEIFENMGIVDHYLNTGLKSFGFVFNFKGMVEKPVLDFRILRSRYPYTLIYNQNDTERVLREHLESSYNRTVEWGKQITGLDRDDSGNFTATIKDVVSGKEETLNPSYVVGADGVHSFVRKSLNLPFEGEAYEGMIMQMMDSEIEGYDEDPKWVQYFMEKDSFLLTAPLPNGKYRLLVSDMGESADRKKNTRREAFQEIMETHKVNGEVQEPEWTTQWVIWKRLADIYQDGKLFLCGDSAHVHSPSGGQGMNSCIQDAWNLGWKMAMVWKGEAKQELLSTYGTERKPVAQQVIDGTDHMHEIIMAHGGGMKDRMALTQTPGWQVEVTERIAGVSYTYFDLNPLPEGLKEMPEGPRIGDRAPDVDFSNYRTLFGYARRPSLTMFLMPSDDTDIAATILKDINSTYGHIMDSKVIANDPIEGLSSEIFISDPDANAAELYGSGDEGRIYIMRPDGYIGFKCYFSEFENLKSYLDMWFVANNSE